MTIDKLRSLRSIHRHYLDKSRRDVRGTDVLQAYLDGIVDMLRTSFDKARSPYQPEAYGCNILRRAYEIGFGNR